MNGLINDALKADSMFILHFVRYHSCPVVNNQCQYPRYLLINQAENHPRLI